MKRIKITEGQFNRLFLIEQQNEDPCLKREKLGYGI
jgi:hypothetical protein